MKKSLALILALTMLLALVACSEKPASPEKELKDAASFPGNETITMIVPFDPGSGDTEARMFAQYVSKYLGTTIVASNISGGGGGVGTQHVLSSAADGYTYGFASASIAYGMAFGNIAATPDDVQLLCTFNGDWMGIFVPSDSPFETFEDLVAYAKDQPDELLIGGTNVGSAHHCFYTTLANDAGISCTYVPYGGANDTVLALLGGELDAAVLSPASIRQYMETDGVRLLTVSTKERVSEFPEVPTAYELGYESVADIIQFRAYLVPAGVPEEVLDIYDKATEQAFNDPEYQKYLADNNLTPFYKNHVEAEEYFDQFIETAKTATTLMG